MFHCQVLFIVKINYQFILTMYFDNEKFFSMERQSHWKFMESVSIAQLHTSAVPPARTILLVFQDVLQDWRVGVLRACINCSARNSSAFSWGKPCHLLWPNDLNDHIIFAHLEDSKFQHTNWARAQRHATRMTPQTQHQRLLRLQVVCSEQRLAIGESQLNDLLILNYKIKDNYVTKVYMQL